jgi:LPXTG-site transpeptidase (sortase) family protein
MPSRSSKKSASKRKRSAKKKQRAISSASVVKVAKPKFGLSRRAIALITITLGINLILFSGVYLLYRQTVLSFKATPQFVVQAALRTAEPSVIEVDELKLKQLVTPAEIIGGVWQTSETNATHLASSARPGEGGNIVIYGHNREKIFRKLHQAKKGQVIRVKTLDGLQHEYQISEIHRVKPDQIELVLPTDHEVLTVYTCIGWLDSERLVIQAKPTVQPQL